MTWSGFLEAPAAGEHAVQVFDDVDDLADSVARFLGAGFRAGDPGLVIASAARWERFAAALAAGGFDVEPLRAEGTLVVLDAEETLARLVDAEGMPSPERFEDVVGGVVDRVVSAFPERTVRAFGDMVDLLWRDGREPAAIALEELWNALAETRRFALLCGYNLDIFDVAVQRDALPRVFHQHSHHRAAADAPRLAAAVDQGLVEVVGPERAARMYLDAAEQVPRGAGPRALALLASLSRSEDELAPKILRRIRGHYEAAAGRL